jgi:hypothetical protein
MRKECCNSSCSENDSKKNQLVRQSLWLLILVKAEEQLLRIRQMQNSISAKLFSLQLSKANQSDTKE